MYWAGPALHLQTADRVDTVDNWWYTIDLEMVINSNLEMVVNHNHIYMVEEKRENDTKEVSSQLWNGSEYPSIVHLLWENEGNFFDQSKVRSYHWKWWLSCNMSWKIHSQIVLVKVWYQIVERSLDIESVISYMTS